MAKIDKTGVAASLHNEHELHELTRMGQDVERMTETQADELLRVLEDMNQASAEFEKTFKEVLPQVMLDNALEATIKASERYFYCIKRYKKAWFITRWWWKRKMEQAEVKFEDAKAFTEKLKSAGMFDSIKTNELWK